MRQRDEAFEAFFMAEHGPVLRTVTLILGDRQAAEDVTQEAFYRLLVHWRKVSQYERPGAWLRRVAIRAAMRSRAQSQRSELVPDRAQSDDAASRLDVREALGHLTAAQRSAVVLFYYGDHPINEVASLMNCTEGTVKTHLHRARQRLAPMLGEGIDDVAR
jgi:RNA polymerase sigma-70 factor (ECF subfamily)